LSIESAAAAMRQAVACLPTEPLLQAATLFDDARTILAAVSQGTSHPEAGTAIQALTDAIARVAQLHRTTSQVHELVEMYLHRWRRARWSGISAVVSTDTSVAVRRSTQASALRRRPRVAG
jgi:hypothetical protein